MKINEYLQLIKQHVDLDSYSFSPGWIGCFERSGRFSEQQCNEAIDLLFNACDLCTAHCVLICNLFVIGGDADLREQYDLNDDDFRDFIHPLIARGAIQRKDHFDEWHPGVGSGSFSVFEEPSSELLRKVFFGMMAVDGIQGHCFGVIPHLGLVIYPHEETGFGFICVDEDIVQKEQLRTFVKESFKAEGFVTNIAD